MGKGGCGVVRFWSWCVVCFSGRGVGCCCGGDGFVCNDRCCCGCSCGGFFVEGVRGVNAVGMVGVGVVGVDAAAAGVEALVMLMNVVVIV